MVDVIVVGAGPGGSATAALLRRLGYEVEIWERAAFPRHRIGESLPPRAVGLLKHLGFNADGFAVMEGHTSVWGSPEPQRAVFEDGYGLQVERDRFDQLLIDQASVPVHFGRTATGLLREDGQVVGVRSQDGETKAHFVVMATGPGKGSRQLKQSAMYGYWRNSKHPGGSQSNDTIIESFADGWVWSLRLSSDLRNVTVLLDAPGLSYEDAIRQTSFVRQMLDGAELVSRQSACDASWHCAGSFAEPGMLLVGDAGSVIDPLSSQGVYKALCSAMSAAVVINTCLKRPELATAALEFFNDEERRTYDGYGAGSVATFRSEQRWPNRPFWKLRHSLSNWDVHPKPFSVEIANDIETGRAMELTFRNGAHTRIAQRSTMSGSFIELNEYLVTTAFEYGYRGNHSTTFMIVHSALAAPKSLKQLLIDVRKATEYRFARPNLEGPVLLHVISYMYREGLIETI